MQQNSNTYRFHLEKYTTPVSRHTCPSCGQKRVFVRYIDSEGKFTFPDNVGKCNRVINCGYHYTPKQYFNDFSDAKDRLINKNDDIGVCAQKKLQEKPQVALPPSFIPTEIMERTLACYERNNFVRFLHTLYDSDAVRRMIGRYHVGTSHRWNGATVFWQVDKEGRVHHGKVMLYDPATGKRSHSKFSTARHLLHLPNFNLQQCFFGEHLLADKEKPIALVESEKSAIIAAEQIPQYLWLATGGLTGCLNQRMHIFSDRKVVMFPDMKCLAQWEMKANEMRRFGAMVEVSTFLEDNASEEELSKGLDIADFIIEERMQRVQCSQRV